MKKFVIILLLLMPIFLMIFISFAGRIFSSFVYIEVESVAFVDELENVVTLVKLGKNDEHQLVWKVLPELANNKNVVFSSSNELVVTVNSNGMVKAVDYGYATITIETQDNNKTSSITINVTNEKVERVEINLSEKELSLYQSYKLVVDIFPTTALVKDVKWSSSNPDIVSVDSSGTIKALKTTGENEFVTITAESIDGGHTDTCVVTVKDYVLAFIPELSGSTTYTSNSQTIDLFDLIIYNQNVITKEDISFKIIMGTDVATISGSTLTFIKDTYPVQIKVFTTEFETESTLWLRYKLN